MTSHLSGGRLNITLLQSTLQNELLNLLQKCDGPKVIIWDEWVAAPIGLVAQYSLLRDHGVVKMLGLKGILDIPSKTKHVIYIIRPKTNLMDLIAESVFKASEPGMNTKKEFHVFFVPRKSEFCEKHLTSKRVFGSFTTVGEFKGDLYPFDNDLLSLEFQNDFRDYYLDEDPTCLYQAAVAIKRIEKLYGTIPRVIGVGQSATQVGNLLSRLSKEETNTPLQAPSQSIIDEIILIDRSVDLATVFTTQLTYEGLIDELFGIKSNTAHFPMKKFSTPEESNSEAPVKDKKTLILNSGDEIFAKLRDKNFTCVGGALAEKVRVLQNNMAETKNNKSIQEIKEFVSKLPQMLANKHSLAIHTTIAEYIKEITDTIDFHDILQCEEDFLNYSNTTNQGTFIEDLISQKAPLTQVLRLICLQCVTSSGLKPKVLDHYKRELVHVYGLKTLLSLCNLEKANILRPQSGTRQYTILRKRLTIDGPDEGETKEKSYLDRTYTPITIRLIDLLSKSKGPTALQNIFSLLPFPCFTENQALPSGQNRCNPALNENSIETSKVTLVFFIGGCTYSEVSSLRTLSQQVDSNVDFIIMTTKMINGKTFIESLLEST